MKKVIRKYGNSTQHWVGNGFPVCSLFSYNDLGKDISPFLLLDYAGPYEFAPTNAPRGVGEHPHRGFETVTIVYQGELQHRDSTGAGGCIGPGDVQWMTAASGILHKEFHSVDFTRNGGTLEMVQLWVNLPARNKLSAPGYQTLLNQEIPVVQLPDDAGMVRIIAGSFEGATGPAITYTPMDVWDIRLNAGKTQCLQLVEGRTSLLVVLSGSLSVGSTDLLQGPIVGLLESAGNDVTLIANTEVTILVLSGAQIDEPIVGYGPFVMNSQAQIEQAMSDFQSGTFGHMQANKL